jgi:hypothetical protein
MENLKQAKSDNYSGNDEFSLSETEIQYFENDEENNGAKSSFADSETVLKELEKLFNLENERLTKLLTYHALKWIRYYTGKSSINKRESTEIVSDVIEKILSCKRKWYRDKVPEIKKLLYLAVISEIRNELKKLDYSDIPLYDIKEESNPDLIKLNEKSEKKKKKNPKVLSLNVVNRDGEEYKNSHADIQAAKDFTVSESIFDENCEEIGIYFDKIEKILEEKEDDIACLVLMERRKTTSNKITAENLGVEVKEVEKAVKRFNRIAPEWGGKNQ